MAVAMAGFWFELETAGRTGTRPGRGVYRAPACRQNRAHFSVFRGWRPLVFAVVFRGADQPLCARGQRAREPLPRSRATRTSPGLDRERVRRSGGPQASTRRLDQRHGRRARSALVVHARRGLRDLSGRHRRALRRRGCRGGFRRRVRDRDRPDRRLTRGTRGRAIGRSHLGHRQRERARAAVDRARAPNARRAWQPRAAHDSRARARKSCST